MSSGGVAEAAYVTLLRDVVIRRTVIRIAITSKIYGAASKSSRLTPVIGSCTTVRCFGNTFRNIWDVSHSLARATPALTLRRAVCAHDFLRDFLPVRGCSFESGPLGRWLSSVAFCAEPSRSRPFIFSGGSASMASSENPSARLSPTRLASQSFTSVSGDQIAS